MQSPEVRLQIILHLLITFISFAGCLFLSIPAALLLLGAGLATLAVSLLLYRIRSRKITRISEEIERILRGAEQVQLDSFQEGELSILASEIRKMTIRLREQNSMLHQEKQYLKESMEDISHQLRTPLTSMILLLDMMRTPELSREQRMEYLRELYGLLARMQWQIETLLSLSRLEAGAVQFQQDTFPCAALIRAALEPISIAVELKNITVNVQIEGRPEITGDMQYCTEALGNLLKNCMEHTPEGGSITITASDNTIYTGILITDTGSGIAKEDLPHIFERFYRSSEFSKNGYGIGLAFAKKVITSQNGSIQVHNGKNGGAQFDLRFYKTVV